MIDCTHSNLRGIPVVTMKQNQLGAGYDTGSPNVQWTPEDYTYIHGLGLIPVHIDQGFTGSPVMTATVRDAEAGAWTVQSAINKNGWTAARPTIYAARNDMLNVVQEGWTGDIWLSWPLNSIPTKDFVLKTYPQLAKANLIGVQMGFTNTYDRSVIYDPDWPNKPQAKIVTVPNVVGMTEEKAAQVIASAGLHPHGPPLVKVISQSPAAGTKVAAGSTVSVTVR
jgi:hypothetical protein